MIKFGCRSSLVYPSLFILFLFIRRIIKYILEEIIAKQTLPYLMVSLIFLFETIIASLLLCNQERKNDSSRESNFLGISFGKNVDVLVRPDSNFKIIILLFFGAYFEVAGSLCRRFQIVRDKSKNNIYELFQSKYRSSDIIISSILCYFTLKTKIYNHHKFSLIIVSICLILVITNEFIMPRLTNKIILYIIGLTLTSSICRTFSDTIEKYLFDIDYLDIFKLMIFEDLISFVFSINLFWLDKPKNDIKFLIDINDNLRLFAVIGLLIVYSILSGFKNLYRRYTIKTFTPMARALSESILDPFFIIFEYVERKEENNITSFIIVLICSFLMIFCSCVYNEVLVLYCCGLEKNTFLAILSQNIIKSLELSKDSDIIWIDEICDDNSD